MNPLDSKFLVLEPNENLDIERENQDLLFENGIWKAAKMKHRTLNFFRCVSSSKKLNKTKVLSVQLGKTFRDLKGIK